MKSMRSIQISLTHMSLRRFALVGIVGLSLLSAVAADKTVTFEDSDGTVIWTESIKEGECAFPPSDPVKFGYDFTGWSDGSQVKSYEEIDNLPVTEAKTWTATYTPCANRRLRVIIYSGPGANGGACMNYHRLFRNNSRIEYKHYDSASIRANSTLLTSADMLLIPGGTTAEMWSSLGTNGRQQIADFVKTEGGRYFGTCAGTAFLANDNSGTHMKLAPYTLTAQDKHDSVTISLTNKGQEIFSALGWDGSVDNTVYYSSSPIMSDDASGFVAGTYEFDALATYTSGLNANHLGKNAIYAGRNQLGRLFLMGPHPEYYEATRKFITVGIRWLFNDGVARNGATADQLKAASTGLTFTLPTDKDAKALKVAWGPAKFTDNGAEELLELVHAIDQHEDYVLTPKTADNITAGQLLAEGYDVLVVPKSQGTYSSDAVTAFANAGGKILYESSDGATGVLRELRATKAAQPVPMEGHEDWGLKYPMLGENNDEVALAFTKTGEDMTWTVPSDVNEIECLVIGGGGGGARNYGGGGGAGGLIHQTNLAVTPGSTLTIRVGVGGTGGVLGDILGKAGASSSVTGSDVSLVAQGGGGGGNAKNPGSNGGSGGGSGGHGNSENAGKGVVYAGGAGTAEQGNAGGSVKDFNGTGGAGGGGASAPGTGCSTSGVYAGRAGGAGITLEITGVSVGYAGGGGGGGGYNTSATPQGGTATCGGGAGGAGVKSAVDGGAGSAGTDGTGGGGGGGGRTANGGNGGSGIVIIRYCGAAISGEPAENSWTTQPSINPTSFEEGTTPTLNLGAAAYGTPTANYTAAGIATFAPGEYTLIVTVAATAEYKGLEMQIPFTVTAKTTPPAPPTPTDEVTTNAMADASWGYAITGLGDDHLDVALVFTNCAANAGMSWTVPDGVTSLRYLVVGGGGGGGTHKDDGTGSGTGGGGGGGLLTGTLSDVVDGTTYTITVGNGGAAGSNGGNSAFGSKEALGGGHGAGYLPGQTSLTPASDGGSGGGGASTVSNGKYGAGTAGQGNAGAGGNSATDGIGYTGGGGGGAGGSGTKGVTSSRNGGTGGAGLASDITGVSIGYAGGGGGGGGNTGSTYGSGGTASSGGGAGGTAKSTGEKAGSNGTDGLGGGGGGNGYKATVDGGRGGSGVVIIRYTISNELPFEQATVTVTEPTVVRFTGEKFAPVVTVKLNGQNITDQCQFSWGGDMINAGLYTLTVRGKPGSEYDGKTANAHPIFQIQPLRSTDYGDWGYTYWYREGNDRYYVTAYTNAPLSKESDVYHPLKPRYLWRVPEGVSSAEILAVGGAGGGSGGSGSNVGGGGQGGSVYRQTSFSVTAGKYYEVRLGEGGAGGAANGAGGNGEGTYLYAGTVTRTDVKAPGGYWYEKFTRDSETPKLSANGGTGATAASGTAGTNGAGAGSYNIFITDRNYGYGGAKGDGTAAGAAGSDIYGQGGTGGGTGAAGGTGGDGTLIIRYRVAEATRTAWKQNVQSGDWNTAANWEGNEKPPYKVASGGAEFYMLDGETVVTVNSAAQAQTLAVNNMAPLTLKINNKLTIGDQTSSTYAYENILIGCGSFLLPMTTLEFTGVSSQLKIVPKKDNFGLQIGVGGSREPTAKMSFKIPASGWASQTAAPLYDGVQESPVTIGPACVFEIDARAMTQIGPENKRCLCYADAAGGVRVTGGANYNYLSLNQWLASGRVQMTVPAEKRGVVVWLDESGNEINPDTASAVTGGIWFYLENAIDIKDAVVTISKTTAGFTGSPVAEPTVISVKLNGVDITSSCHLVGWKDENGKTVEGSQLTTWGAYTPIVQARPDQNYYGGTVDNATLPTFEILAAYYHKPGEPAWENTAGWFLDEALTDGVDVYPDNENVQVNVFASSAAANVVGKGSGSVASAKVKTVELRGNASDASQYAALADMRLDVKLEKNRSVIVAERGTGYLSGIDMEILDGSEADTVAYADVQPGATLGIDNVSIVRMVVNMDAGSTLKFASAGLDGSGTSSTLKALQGEGAGTRTVVVENNRVTFQAASDVEGALALQLKPGENNTTANTMLTFGGAFLVGAGSTLTVDAGQKGTGTYTLMTAASGNALGLLAANATVTNLQPGYKAKFVTTETAGEVTKVDLKIERGLIIIFGSALAQ